MNYQTKKTSIQAVAISPTGHSLAGPAFHFWLFFPVDRGTCWNALDYVRCRTEQNSCPAHGGADAEPYLNEISMFIGHYGPALAIKAIRPAIPVWLLFLAVQLVDVGWAVLVLLGVEKLRIVPGITASNPLGLYYVPCTHSLAAVAQWLDRQRKPAITRPCSYVGQPSP